MFECEGDEAINTEFGDHSQAGVMLEIRSIRHHFGNEDIDDTWKPETPMPIADYRACWDEGSIAGNDGADFIGLTAPVSQVASYVQEKTTSGSYIGKGTTMNANMFSSPEGVRELWDKMVGISTLAFSTSLSLLMP